MGLTNLPNLNRSFFKGFDCENKVAPLKSIGVSHPKTSSPATGAISTSSEELWPEEEIKERKLQKIEKQAGKKTVASPLKSKARNHCFEGQNLKAPTSTEDPCRNKNVCDTIRRGAGRRREGGGLRL
jgi:hypothetical protein